MQIKQSLIIDFITIIFLSVILIYLSSVNTLFTDNFYTVELREIDDNVFLNVILPKLGYLKSLDLSKFIGLTYYGYGVIFWILTFISAIPGFIFNSTELIIFGPRFFSTICFIFGCFLIVKTIQRNIPKEFELFSLIGLIGMLMPLTFHMSLRFQNKGIVFFLISLSLYFLLNNNINFYKRVKLSLASQFIAIGITLFAIGSLPILFAIIFEQYKKEKQTNKTYLGKYKKFWKSNILIGFISYILAFQPKLVFFPFFIKDCFRSIRSLLGILFKTKTTVVDNYNYFENLKSALDYYFSFNFIFLISFLSLLLIIFKIKNNTFDFSQKYRADNFSLGNNNSISYGCIYFIFYATILCFQMKRPSIYASSYLMPIIPFLLISLAENITQIFYLFRKVKKVWIFLIFSLIALLFFPINTERFLWAKNLYNSEQILSKLNYYQSYEPCVKELFLKKKKNVENFTVATNWRTPVPCSNLDDTCNRIIEWGKYPNISDSYKPDVIIFGNKDEYNEYLILNKLYIENSSKKDKEEYNYFKENCGELNILIRDK